MTDINTVAEAAADRAADAEAKARAYNPIELMLKELREWGYITIGNFTLEQTDVQSAVADLCEYTEYCELLGSINAGDFADIERIIEITRIAERAMCKQYVKQWEAAQEVAA